MPRLSLSRSSLIGAAIVLLPALLVMSCSETHRLDSDARQSTPPPQMRDEEPLSNENVSQPVITDGYRLRLDQPGQFVERRLQTRIGPPSPASGLRYASIDQTGMIQISHGRQLCHMNYELITFDDDGDMMSIKIMGPPLTLVEITQLTDCLCRISEMKSGKIAEFLSRDHADEIVPTCLDLGTVGSTRCSVEVRSTTDREKPWCVDFGIHWSSDRSMRRDAQARTRSSF